MTGFSDVYIMGYNHTICGTNRGLSSNTSFEITIHHSIACQKFEVLKEQLRTSVYL